MTQEDKIQTNETAQTKESFLSFLKKPKARIAITAILVIALIVAGIGLLNGNGNNAVEIEALNKQIKTQTVDSISDARIEAIGTVKADTKIAVKALTSGTIRSVQFAVGDKVTKNSTLANLSNDTVLTNLINAQTNLVNLERNASITKQLTTEVLKQAELETERAEEAVNAAEIALNTAKDNLINSKNINVKGDVDTKNNAVISIADNLNTVFNTLKQINTITDAEDDSNQIAGIKNTLAALKPSTLNTALNTYRIAKNNYEILSIKQYDTNNITQGMQEMATLLAQTKTAVGSTIEVLENTVASADFSQAALTVQRDKFIGIRSSVVATQTAVERTLQSLQNVGLANTQQTDSLENAVTAAENQLASAKLNYQNALVGLSNAKISVERDLLSTESSVDNSRSQLNLVQVQASDLRISAPISGVITSKMIDLGDEINPGQTIAEISQTDKLIIEVDLPAEESLSIKTGQMVYINPATSDTTGLISQIYPTADPISKKVRVEIAVDMDNLLVAESFVDISIPTEYDTENDTGKNAFFVPLKAVTISPNENYVFVLDETQARKVIVEVGKTNGSQIEILSGLEQGDQLIIEGNKNIIDGETVEIIN